MNSSSRYQTRHDPNYAFFAVGALTVDSPVHKFPPDTLQKESNAPPCGYYYTNDNNRSPAKFDNKPDGFFPFTSRSHSKQMLPSLYPPILGLPSRPCMPRTNTSR